MPAQPMLAAKAALLHAQTPARHVVVSDDRRRGAGARAARAERKGLARVRRAPQASGLGNNAKSGATAGQDHDQKRDLRAQRYSARAWLSVVRTRRTQARWKDCGRKIVASDRQVGLKLTGTAGRFAAGLSGLETCGSAWACPVCSAKIAARRTGEVERLLAWNAARGGSVALATFTMKHHTGHKLKQQRKALSAAWRHITRSRAWKTTRAREGCDGYVRAVEATHGDNGWHLHAHVLLLFDGPVTTEFVEEWSDDLYQLWSDGLAKSGMTASRKHGVDVRLGTGALDGLGKYLSKLTYEAAGGRFKQGRKGGRTPFELLSDGLTTGNADDMDRWFEWESGSKGMQQLVWSNGLKALVGVGETSDEEIAEDDQLDGGTVLLIPAADWQGLYWEVPGLLHAAEQGGCPAAMSWLDRHGYRYETSLKYEVLAE